MIESQGSTKLADANNNDDCKPLTLLSETDKCLELNSALQASTSDAPPHRPPATEARTTPMSSSKISAAASQAAGSSTGSNVANSTLTGATNTAGYVPQQPKSERKAAKTLSAILLAFIITWTPYNVVALLRSTLDDQNYIPKTVSGDFRL